MSANGITFQVPDELVEEIAQRVLDQLGREPASADRWLRGAEEIATYLGCSTSRVYSLVSTHRIPVSKDGAAVVVKTSTLDRWIEKGGASCPS